MGYFNYIKYCKHKLHCNGHLIACEVPLFRHIQAMAAQCKHTFGHISIWAIVGLHPVPHCAAKCSLVQQNTL